MILTPMNKSRLFTLWALTVSLAPPVVAQDSGALTWSEQKCVIYARAVDDALEFQGLDGLRQEFLRDNTLFIEGGCQTPGRVCPETDAERALANLLTIMTMNEGMASTFVPFNCRDHSTTGPDN